MPGAAASGANAASIEGFGNPGEARHPGRLNRANDRQHVGSKLIRGGTVSLVRFSCGLGRPRIAEFQALRLFGGKSRLGTLGDQGPLLFGECRVKMQHKRVGVRTEFSDDERDPMCHQPADEVHISREAVERAVAERKQQIHLATVELYDARKQKFAETHPDFSEIAESPNLAITTTMAMMIANDEHGPRIAYWLGQNPSEAARIAAIQNPATVIYEIGKISARVSAAPASRQSSTRASASSRQQPAARAPRKEDMNAYAARRMKELAAERLGGRMRG